MLVMIMQYSDNRKRVRTHRLCDRGHCFVSSADAPFSSVIYSDAADFVFDVSASGVNSNSSMSQNWVHYYCTMATVFSVDRVMNAAVLIGAKVFARCYCCLHCMIAVWNKW